MYRGRNMHNIIGVVVILAGLLLMLLRYRVIIGGTRVKAEVVGWELASTDRYGTSYYRAVFGFDYNGGYLTKPTVSVSKKPLPKGECRYVYYNVRFPGYVARVEFGGIAVVSLVLIALGLYMIFFV